MSENGAAAGAGPGGIPKDVLAGLLFAVFGIVAIWFARSYEIGTITRMGPGFFPMLVGSLLTVFGLALAATSLRSADSALPVTRPELRALLGIVLAVFAFGVLVEPFGFLLAVLALVVIGRLAGVGGSLVELAILAAVLSAAAILIFIVGLEIPITILPP